MSPRCLCAGQKASRAKLAASKEVSQDAPYPEQRLDAGKHPASHRTAQFQREGGAATPHPRPAQTWEKRRHRGGPGDIASGASGEPGREPGMQGKLPTGTR